MTSGDVEVVELPGAPPSVLVWEPPDPLAGAEIVSVSADPPSGGAVSSRFIYHQTVPQSVWPLQHNRGQEPVAWVLRDTTGRECSEYTVENLSPNAARASMDIPTAGSIVLLF